MLTKLKHLLMKAGIIRRTHVAPTSRQPRTPEFIPPSPPVPDLPPNAWDAVGGAGKDVEPAMAGIPEDAVQMPPPVAATPGLPPVDPVSMAKVDRVEESPALPAPTTPKKRATSRQQSAARVRGGNLHKVAHDNLP